MRNVIFLVLTVLFSFCAEGEVNEAITLNFDIETMEDVDVSKLLDTLSLRSDSLVIGDLNAFWANGEDVVLVADNGVFRFDGESGELVNTISSKGRANNEFVYICQVIPDGEQLLIYDFGGKKILRFGMDGTFYNSKMLVKDTRLQFFVRLNDTLFVGKCLYSRKPEAELALYDENWNHKMDVDGLKLNSGMYSGVPMLQGEGEVLYMPLFSSKVYSINHEAQTKLKYNFYFGEYHLDAKRFENNDDIFSHIKKNNYTGKMYALPFYLLADNEDYMIMSFTYCMEKCIGLYDKAEKVEKCFRFVGNEGDKLLEYVVYNNVLHILFENEDSLKMYRYKI
ncbi:MAG: 6-bladed beta-propeller [Marinifilaceae bacterium]